MVRSTNECLRFGQKGQTTYQTAWIRNEGNLQHFGHRVTWITTSSDFWLALLSVKQLLFELYFTAKSPVFSLPSRLCILQNCPVHLQYVKKHKHSRDSLKINTFPCGTVDWLIGAVRNRNETKQSLYQWHTGKKKPESCGSATVGESCGTGSRQRRSLDSQIPNTYTRSQAALDDVKTKALCFLHHSVNGSKVSPSRSAYYWWRRRMVSFIIQRVNISMLSLSKMDILKRRQRETDGKPIR